jgi:hypothetical protein
MNYAGGMAARRSFVESPFVTTARHIENAGWATIDTAPMDERALGLLVGAVFAIQRHPFVFWGDNSSATSSE